MAGLEALPPKGAADALYTFDLYGAVWRYFKAPGQAKWAGRQFANLMSRVLRERAPAYVAVASDNPWPTWRAEASAGEWKATRTPLPASEKAALLEQVRHAQEALEDVFGVRWYTARGFDGDDVVATLTEAGLRKKLRVVIVGHDKDFAQCVENAAGRRVVVWDGRETVIDTDAVRKKFGVYPRQMRDYQAIVGDSSDNVPGVYGVGPKGAPLILEAFGTLDAALESAERGSASHAFWQDNGRLWSRMAGGRTAAEKCRELVTLRRDVDLGLSADLAELKGWSLP